MERLAFSTRHLPWRLRHRDPATSLVFSTTCAASFILRGSSCPTVSEALKGRHVGPTRRGWLQVCFIQREPPPVESYLSSN